MSSLSNVDKVIDLLLSQKCANGSYIKMEERLLNEICTKAIQAFQRDPMLLAIEAPVTIIGDIHGQFNDLVKYFEKGGKPPSTNYLFLGDYVDRGRNSIETITLLLCYKIKYPNNFWMLRGNHETKFVSQNYGFLDECSQRYSPNLWTKFTDVFEYMPLAAVISDRIFCVHGGLSRELRDLDQIRSIPRPLTSAGETELVVDLLWSDPSPYLRGFHPSERGVSYSYGEDVVDAFLQKNEFDLVCRAHQVVNKGFEFPFGQKRTVLTIFSAPDYCGEFNNKGAMLIVNEKLECQFESIKP